MANGGWYSPKVQEQTEYIAQHTLNDSQRTVEEHGKITGPLSVPMVPQKNPSPRQILMLCYNRRYSHAGRKGGAVQQMIYEYDAEVTDYLNSVAELFRKLRDRGLLIMEELPTAPGIDAETNAVFLLYRNAMALLDAVAELSGLPSVEGAKVLFRSFFETKCNLEYMVEADLKDRAVAYQTRHLINRIRRYEKLDPTTDRGKEFKAKWEKDTLFGGAGYEPVDTRAEIANLKKQLEREPYKTAWGKLAAAPTPNWYSIDNGPRKLIDLCERLGYPLAYDFFYRQWSGAVHGTDAYIDSFYSAEGEGRAHALRAVKGYPELVDVALTLTVDFLLKITQAVLPKHHERLYRFYKNTYLPYRKKHIDGVIIVAQE